MGKREENPGRKGFSELQLLVEEENFGRQDQRDPVRRLTFLKVHILHF